MANQAIINPGRALDLNGYVLPGAKATFYLSGTDTLASIFADVAEAVPAANPAVADGNGVFPQRFVTASVKVVITSADDETLYTIDPVPVVQSTGSGASQVSFAATVDVPATNVQDAIELVSASVLSGVTDFGIGITGNAPLLVSIDTTTTAAGIYRFDATTTGTYPTGAAATDQGLVRIWRLFANEAVMELNRRNINRVWRRLLISGTWGAWEEVIAVPQGAAEGDIIYRNATVWTRLAKGTAGQALVINAGATAPEWAAVEAGIGVGQTWQDVESSRTGGTSYQNTTGKPIMVSIYTNQDTIVPQVSVDNATWVTMGRFVAGQTYNVNFIVPNDHYYRLSGAKGSITGWVELR